MADGRAADFHRFDFSHGGKAVFPETPFHIQESGFPAHTAELERDLTARIAERTRINFIGKFDYDAVHRIGHGFDLLHQIVPRRTKRPVSDSP